MKVRPLKPEDIPILKHYAEVSGYEYPEPNDINIEKLLVVVDDEDVPIAAVAAKRLAEVFCWISPNAGAELRIEAMRALHEPTIHSLKRMGYDCAEAFIPAKLARRGFGRILTERFGWYPNVLSWGKRLK